MRPRGSCARSTCRSRSTARTSSRARASASASSARRSRRPQAAELLRNADVAMYMAKRDSKGSYRVFESTMHERVVERLELRSDLQHALSLDQLELHYQPVVRLAGREILGVEALLRWNHPDARNDPAEPVHSRGRGDRPDHPDRALGSRVGVPRGRSPPRAVPPRRAADDEREPLRQAAAVGDDRLRRARRARGDRASGGLPRARDHRVADAGRHRLRDAAAARAEVARHPPGDGRFRDRLLVAQLPQPTSRWTSSRWTARSSARATTRR